MTVELSMMMMIAPNFRASKEENWRREVKGEYGRISVTDEGMMTNGIVATQSARYYTI